MLPYPDFSLLVLIAFAGLYAGTQNTLAGGGSFITFPTLLLAGLDPLAANITSTIALFPNQITSSLEGRKLAGGVGNISLGHTWGYGQFFGKTESAHPINDPKVNHLGQTPHLRIHLVGRNMKNFRSRSRMDIFIPLESLD